MTKEKKWAQLDAITRTAKGLIMYEIESLIKTFSEHAVSAEEIRRKMLEEFKINYPDEPIPDHMKDGFSLPTALCRMCEEIRNLKEKIWTKKSLFED